MGRFAGLVAELEECAEVSRRAFEGVRSAGCEVTSADLTELLSALGVLDRSAQGAATAALAQFARREEVQDPHDL